MLVVAWSDLSTHAEKFHVLHLYLDPFVDHLYPPSFCCAIYVFLGV